MPDNRFSLQDLAALWQTSADLRRQAQAIIERARQLCAQIRERRQRTRELRPPTPEERR